MLDQATMLRQMMELERSDFPEPDSSVPIILVGSGKGGVGKSVCSVVVAGALAERGAKTLLVDGDLNLANLHLLLGARPNVGLERVLFDGDDPSDLVQQVAPNLWLLAGDSGAEGLHGLNATDRARLHHKLSGLFGGFDSVVVDSGAGIDSAVRVATMNPTTLVVVTAPEPAAITDAYALIKLAHFQAPDLEVGVVVNRCLNNAEGQVAYDKLSEATNQFLGRSVRLFGLVPEDIEVLKAVRQPRALMGERNDSPAIAAFRDIAWKYLAADAMASDVQSFATTQAG